MDISELKQLNNLISAIIDSAECLLAQADTIFAIGCPDTKEEYCSCSEILFYNPVWDEFLEGLRNVKLSETDAQDNESLLNVTHETIIHGISLSAQINDLKWFFRPYYAFEKSEFIQALNPVAQACNSLRYHLFQLNGQYTVAVKDWPQFDDKDLTPEEDEKVHESLSSEHLLEHDGYIRILQAVMLIQCHTGDITHKQSEFFQFLIQQLNQFALGVQFQEFSFSLDLRVNEELLYLKFSSDCDCVSVSEAGSTYDPFVGSDSYTNWEYTIWGNGQDEGSLELNEDKILEMIQMGATLSIDEPYDFMEETQED